MKISKTYSHLNGEEWLKSRHPQFWVDIEESLAAVDASKLKTKLSQEKTMRGRRLYSPPAINEAISAQLNKRGWLKAPDQQYYVCEDAGVTAETIGKPYAEQKIIIEKAGLIPYRSSNKADFFKERVSIEVQLGKYSFVTFDIFVKHTANYMQGKIDLGIEIVPMKALEKEMSSGPGYFEKHLHEIIRQGRIFPPVPLVLIGVEP